jgi:poly(hydroxyalkanoate) depolymerase family esterase
MKLNPDFARRMAEATALTRAGRLNDAVATLQEALAAAHPATTGGTKPFSGVAANFEDIVDVEAREVPADGAGAAPPSSRNARPKPANDEQVSGRFVAGHFGSAAGTLGYKLYLPPAHHGPGRPLVVMLHGCTQHPDDFAAGTRMNAAAAERGLVVLYPAQTEAVNPRRCWRWFERAHQRRDAGEPAVLAGMVREVIARYAADPQRVYVAGLSAGGAMAAVLGDLYPDLFAAVGVHSGLPAGAAGDVKSGLVAMKRGAPAALARTPRRPTIVFHGDRDAIVHPANGERLAAGAPATVERLSGQAGRPYTRHVHRDEAGRVVAEHWVVHGAGHAWSGGSPTGSFADPLGPCATTEMLRFFAAHRLGDA